MARRSVQPSYAERVCDQRVFARESLTLHRRITSMVDTSGGMQVPWLRAVGTPPWAAAREMRLITSADYHVHPTLRGADAWRHVGGATQDRPVVVYVGNRVAPRHVVLVVSRPDEDHTWTYEPAAGSMVLVSRHRWVEGPVALAGWNRPWFVIAPERSPR
jgi:hypothetical protein